MLESAFSAILAGKSEPIYVAHFPNTLNNRLFLAAEISKLYGAFLTPEMHEGDLCETLQQGGMWIQKKYIYHPAPTSLQTSLFIKVLEEELVRSLDITCDGSVWVHLGYDYGPTSAILEFVFQEVGLSADFYYLIPYKSHTHIYIRSDEVILNLNLKGPPI
jgi:hypothetical protein